MIIRRLGPLPRRPAWRSPAGAGGLPGRLRRRQHPLRSASFYPVKGKVSLPDGKPLAGVKVVFAGPATGSATTESDGTFTVKGDKDGLPEGDYKVRLEVARVEGDDQEGRSPPFPGKYLDEDASDLTRQGHARRPQRLRLQAHQGRERPGTQPAWPRRVRPR